MPTRSMVPRPAAGGRIHACARVSSPDQAEPDRTSLDEQVRIICDNVARYHADAPIIVWREEGFTAATPLAERPVAKKMLANLQPGDTVVCTRVDRLSRHMSSACAQMEAWQRQGIKVMLLDLPIQPGTDWDAATTCCFHMLMAFAQYERGRMRERTFGGKRALQARGLYTEGTAPFGFTIEHIGPPPRATAGRASGRAGDNPPCLSVVGSGSGNEGHPSHSRHRRAPEPSGRPDPGPIHPSMGREGRNRERVRAHPSRPRSTQGAR